jgi:hypothetical protein
MAQLLRLARWHFLEACLRPDSAVLPDSPFSGSGLDVTGFRSLVTVSPQWQAVFRLA